MAQSPEERKARNTERMRLKRAAATAERAAVKPVGRDLPTGTPMHDAVESALLAMKWLMPSDDASVAQARMLAEDVDALRSEGETTKSLSAQRALSKVLHDLGGTPVVRQQQELRSLRANAVSTEVPDDEDEKPTGNVSSFKRPAKRGRTA